MTEDDDLVAQIKRDFQTHAERIMIFGYLGRVAAAYSRGAKVLAGIALALGLALGVGFTMLVRWIAS